MATTIATKQWTCQERLDALRKTKLAYTREKQETIGSMDYDDWGLILPPEEYREVVKSVSGSGIEVTEIRIKGVKIESNHPSGFFSEPGPAARIIVGCWRRIRCTSTRRPAWLAAIWSTFTPIARWAGTSTMTFLT